MKTITAEVIDFNFDTQTINEAVEGLMACIECNLDGATEINILTNPLTVSLLQSHHEAVYAPTVYDDPRILAAPEGYLFVGSCIHEGIRLNVYCNNIRLT